jgi:hypothetical protein
MDCEKIILIQQGNTSVSRDQGGRVGKLRSLLIKILQPRLILILLWNYMSDHSVESSIIAN